MTAKRSNSTADHYDVPLGSEDTERHHRNRIRKQFPALGLSRAPHPVHT